MQPEPDKEDADVDQIHQFWKEFHLFPLRTERWGLKYWYLLIILPYVAAFVLTVVTGYLYVPPPPVPSPPVSSPTVPSPVAAQEHGNTLADLVRGLTVWARIKIFIREFFLLDNVFNSTGLGLLLAGSAFVAWEARLKRFFQFVWETGLAKGSVSEAELNANFYKILREYRDKLESKKRYIAVIGITLLALIPASRHQYFYTRPASSAQWVWHFEELIKWAGAWLIWAYCLGVCGWATYATASSISKLPDNFEINLQPSHPDRSGGLREVGQFCLLMVSPILISILYLTIFGVLTNMNLPMLQTLQPPIDTRVINALVLFIIAIPLATFVFLKTLWSFHTMMLHRRRQYERAQGLLISTCLADLKSNLENNDIASAKIASEKLDLIRKMDTDNIGFPVWPFDRKILFRFATPQVLSALGYLAVFIRGKILH